VDMLYNERQKRHFARDTDLPLSSAAASALLPGQTSQTSSPGKEQQQ